MVGCSQRPGRGVGLPASLAAVLVFLATGATPQGQADRVGGAALPGAPAALVPTPPPSGERFRALAGAPDTLERLAAEATAAVVLIDVRTPSGTRQGSGFLVDPSGRILTNEHVIREARSARVKLASGDIYDQVAVLGTDERRDIAVLQIPGFGLPALPLGNSDSVSIGAPVVAIGSPLGLENTVSTGIMSGRRQEEGGYQLLQISAPTSNGSSGGPVLSRDGRVIGIAVSQIRAGQNLNFAVPINYARGLLSDVDRKPVAVLAPEPLPPGQAAYRPLPGANGVNQGIRFDLDRFGGFRLEMEGRYGEQGWHRTRITYRRIETVGGGKPRVERYAESETTERTGPFGTPQTIRTERRRTIVGAEELRPISARGEIAWRSGGGWQRAEYDVRFDGYRVRGILTDTTGRAQELDRELPPGIILREVADLAFAALTEDSLLGRSVELVTFDPRTGEVTHDRYDVIDTAEVEAAGRSYPALRVNVATGLTNSTVYFRSEPPRIPLRRESAGSGLVMEVTGLELFPAPPPAETEGR